MTQQDQEQLKLEIQHIFDSGANEIRIFEMVRNFVDNRKKINKKMAICNPRIHVICGMCGCNHMFKFKIKKELNDDTGELENRVRIFCENCKSLTDLDELIKEEK